MIQVSVAIPDRPGELARTVKSLGNREVDIKALYLSRTNGEVPEGKVRMIVTNPALAMQALQDEGLKPVEEDVVVAALDDQPGGLAQVLDVLQAADINVEYAYGFVSRDVRRALSILGVVDRAKAREVLKQGGVTLVDQDAAEEGPSPMTVYLGGEWYW